MIETSKPQIERWKGLAANVAPCLQKEGEFFRVEGVTNLDYGVERAKGKKLLLVVDGPILNLVQIAKIVVLQIGTTLNVIPISDFIIPTENMVIEDGIQVVEDGQDIYEGN